MRTVIRIVTLAVIGAALLLSGGQSASAPQQVELVSNPPICC
jgi:hypothetical protein